MDLVFLDRDGVINRFPGKGLYLTRKEDFQFLPRTLTAIRLLSQAECELVVVSNQGGVSRGLMTLEELNAMTQQMLEAIRGQGGRIDQVHYCLHQTSDACECKKPKTALFEKTLRGRRGVFNSIYMIGDSEEDIQAGHAVGCQTVLVLSGRSAQADCADFSVKPNVIKNDLWEAAEWVLQRKS